MNIFKTLKKYRKYRNTINELNLLSNRELNDLGIARGDIPNIARKCIH